MSILATDPPSWLSVLIDAAAAIGTLGATSVALFPERARDIFSPAGAEILFNPREPDHTSLGPGVGEVIMHNVRVINTSEGGRILHRCSVLLYALSKLDETTERWEERQLPVALPLAWAPFETQPIAIDLRPNEYATLNLLWLRELPLDKVGRLAVRFVEPVLATGQPRNFRGQLHQAGRIRYHVELRADELREPIRSTFEVDWSRGGREFEVRKIVVRDVTDRTR
jgi:hypothetical protein